MSWEFYEEKNVYAIYPKRHIQLAYFRVIKTCRKS